MKILSAQSFYCVRHGETDWNIQHKAMGSQDIELNDRGILQAHQAALLLNNEPIATIVTSPLRRARQTADKIAQYMDAFVLENPGLSEACWGEKESQPIENGSWINDWMGGYPIPGSEKYTDFVNRIKNTLDHVLDPTLGCAGPILMVSHGFVYSVIQNVLRLPIMDIPNAEPVYLVAPANPTHPWRVYPLRQDGL
ncbi:MAG: histidine phosphatase family protein [Alphaproteobacteria bacterium]|nr:histidine phosphatase family protein [Alphaproteobacteria bacterium]